MNSTLRLRGHPPPKIRGPPGIMDFSNDEEEEKGKLSNKLLASIK
jgi:hypothetical protein